MAEKVYQCGEVIFKKNDLGDTFYQILEGSVRIVLDNVSSDPIVLAELGVGQYFGEMAVLDVRPRSATAIAAADGTKLLELSEKEMDSFFSDKPEKAIELIRHLGERIRTVNGDYMDVIGVIQKIRQGDSSADERLLDKVRRFLGFHTDSKATRPSVEALERSQGKKAAGGYDRNLQTYSNGTILFREGEPSDCMYEIQYGSVGIFSAYGTEKEQKIATLGVNDFFGEMGLVSEEVRSATAVVQEDNTLLERISMEELMNLFEKNPPRVWEIVSLLSGQLRKMDEKFRKACDELYELQK